MRPLRQQLADLPNHADMLRDPALVGGALWLASQGDGSAPQAVADAGAVGRRVLRLVILGEPASKANSRQIVMFGKRPAVIKSKKAREFEKAAVPQVLAQCRAAGWRCIGVGRLKATIRIFYASERPDLDESVILDVMQQIVFANDRQVRERHVYHAIDRANPRAEIEIEAVQGELL